MRTRGGLCLLQTARKTGNYCRDFGEKDTAKTEDSLATHSRFKSIAIEVALVLLIGSVVAAIGLGVNRWSARSPFTPLKVGDRIALKGSELGGATIILATSATSQYCRDSQTFHQALIAKAHEFGRKVLVVTSRKGEVPAETVLALE